MHATILKGIVGDFKCTVFQRNLEESYGRSLIYVCECWRKVTKVWQLESLETVYWSYPITPFGIVGCTLFLTNFLKIAVYIITQTRSVWTSRLDCITYLYSCHQMNSDRSPKISTIVLPIIWINFVNVKFFLALLLIFLSQFSTSNKLVPYNQKTGMH